MATGTKPLISISGIVWDPQKVSEHARNAVDWMFRWIGAPLSIETLDAFEDRIINATPTNYLSDIDTRPMIEHPSGLTVIYDNGVHEKTESHQNIPSLLFIGATFDHHQLAQMLTEYGRYARTGPKTFRIYIDADDLIISTGHLLQRPSPTPLPPELYRP